MTVRDSGIYNADEIPIVNLAASKLIGVISVGVALLAMTGCGGGGSNPGGGRGGNSLQVTLISPSMVMSDISIAGFTVIGSGFTQQSQVLIDGKPPAFPVMVEDSEHIEVNLPGTPTVGVHQITVQDGSQVSNSLPFTYYSPQPGPAGLFDAIPGYFGTSQMVNLIAVVGDFNGDGRADVIVPTPPQNIGDKFGSALLLGQADGSLSVPRYLPNVLATVAGDVDGDGTLDLVAITAASTGGALSCNVYLNDGHANFTLGPSCPFFPTIPEITAVLKDVNGDGLPDLVVAGQYSPLVVLLNQGGGNFGSPITEAVTGNSWSLAVADFNGNGLPDIAYNAVNATTGEEEVHILVNQGSGIFQDTKPTSLQGVGGLVFAGDLNLDGKADLVVEIAGSVLPMKLQVFLSQGNNVFSFASETDLYPSTGNLVTTSQFVIGDFDHDGFPDLAGQGINAQPAQMLFLWGNGSGQFGAPQYLNGPEGALAVGDVNGDGLPDIVVQGVNETDVVVGRTDRNFPSLPLLIPAPGPDTSIAAGAEHPRRGLSCARRRARSFPETRTEVRIRTRCQLGGWL